jgi:hypothetical protein
MIVEWALKLADVVVKVVFSLLGVLPSMPDSVTSVVDNFFDLIFVVIAIVNFDKIYKLIMWILRKIPFIGVE